MVIRLKAGEDDFKVGKDGITDIRIIEEHGLVEIEYDNESEWDKRLISIHHVGMICFNEESYEMEAGIGSMKPILKR